MDHINFSLQDSKPFISQGSDYALITLYIRDLYYILACILINRLKIAECT
jgi:hypothetical protein